MACVTEPLRPHLASERAGHTFSSSFYNLSKYSLNKTFLMYIFQTRMLVFEIHLKIENL